MTGTSRIGVLLLLVLAGWVVLWYLVFSDIARSDVEPGDGLNILESDTVGTNPDDEPVVEEQPPPVQREPEPRTVEPEPDPGEQAPPAGRESSVIPPPPPTTPYTVQHRDTMESIAAEWFGDKSKWVLIAHENPLVDPLKLKAGQNLRLPPRDAKLDAIPIEELRRLTRSTKYVVVDGDSLWKIAAKFYGNGALHPIISEANRDVLGRSSDLQLGMELVIPPYQKPAD